MQADTYREQLIARYPFYRSALEHFAPVYPVLARQLVDDYGITEGICVDVGGGCGPLSLELAKITNLTCYVVDMNPAAVRLCALLADEAELTGRVRGVEGQALDLPLRSDFANLVVSRGSIFFWPSQIAGLKEVYRVLRPGGAAYVGCGVTSSLDPETRDGILAWRKAREMTEARNASWRPIEADIVQQCEAAGIRTVRMIHEPESGDDYGYWIEIRK